MLYIILTILFLPTKALAFSPENYSVIENPSQKASGVEVLDDIQTSAGYAQTLDNIIMYMLMVAGGLAFIALLVGSVQYLLAAGDQQKAVTAKKTITYAIIGIVVITALFVILEFVAGGLLAGITS